MAYYTDSPGGGAAAQNPGTAAIPGVGGIVAGMAQVKDQMAHFTTTARAGGFSVNDAGGKALLGAIQEMRQWYREKMPELDFLRQAPSYGTSHGAQVVQPFMQAVAADDQGLLRALKELDQVLDEADQGIKQAMNNYRNTEQQNADSVRRAGDGLGNTSPSHPNTGNTGGDTYYV